MSKIIEIGKGKKRGKKSRFDFIKDFINGFINNIDFSELVLLFTSSKMFDMQRDIKSRNYEIKSKPFFSNFTISISKTRIESKSFFNDFIVSISRTENTIYHQRVFDVLLQTCKPHNTTKETVVGIITGLALEINDMHEFKKTAGLEDYTDEQVADIVEDIAQIHIDITKIDKNKKQTNFMSFHLLGDTSGKFDTKTQKCIDLTVWLDSIFFYLLTALTKTRTDADTLKYIHQNAKTAVVEKIIKFFLPLHSEFVFKDDDFLNLVKQISDIPVFNKKTKENIYPKFDDKSGQYRNEMLKNIDAESDLLKEFGIEFDKKQLSISYNPTKSKFYKSNILPVDYFKKDNV